MISCGSSSSISKIDRYVNKIDNRKDFSESIIEYVVEESTEHNITGGSEIYVLTDNNGNLKRIIADENESNRKPSNYQFYYRDSILIYARIIKFNGVGTDIITDSNFYFKDEKLIERKDRKDNRIHSEDVKEIAEYYKRKGE